MSESPRGLQFDENVEVRNIQEGGSLDGTMHTMVSVTSKRTDASSTQRGGGGFLGKLDALQNQQAMITKKCEKEKKKQNRFNQRIDELQRLVLELQAATNNGARVVEDERACEKAIHRLEHKIQKLRIKLSVTRTDNNKIVKAINEQRKDKNLNLEVLHGLEKETERVKTGIKDANREIIEYNERKHSAKLELTKAKTKMIVDMESFKGDLESAKKVMNDNQEALMQGIKDKMDLAMYAASLAVPTRSQEEDEGFDTYEEPDTAAILKELCDMSGVASLEGLLDAINVMEGEEFRLYKDIQERSGEVEEVEKEHKRLSKELEQQRTAVDGLEKVNADRRQDLEEHIQIIEGQIAQHESSYKANLEIIQHLSEPMINLLRSLSIEGEALDQQLLAAGINERNITQFLSLLEQRIDFIMQLDKAAGNQALRREDFSQGENVMSGAGIQPPSIPSMDDAGDDDVEEDDTSKVFPVDIKSVKKFMDQKLFPNKYGKFEKSGRRTISGGGAPAPGAPKPMPPAAAPPQPQSQSSAASPEKAEAMRAPSPVH